MKMLSSFWSVFSVVALSHNIIFPLLFDAILGILSYTYVLSSVDKLPGSSRKQVIARGH
jgi:hypothetical protein